MNSLLTNSALRRLANLVPGGVRDKLATALGLRAGEDPAVEALRGGVEQRLRANAHAHERAWRAVRTPADWERFRDERIDSLRQSLGPPRKSRAAPGVRASGRHEQAGVVIETLSYAGHLGVPVTAGLYRPASASVAPPGILICHSHHCDRSHDELRQMGLLWARSGCTVLVPDLIGHGQRRLHPFDSDDDYNLPFKPHRQDYYFRYNLGLQLGLSGHCLIGWMVGDMLSSFDVLLDHAGVDEQRTVLIGSVAGGGDVAAITAALEPRIACLVSFGYHADEITIDAEEAGGAVERIPGAGTGSWESTRNLRLSARDGFLPWVVLAARAPRHFVYAHEFSWDPAGDAQWSRLRRIYGMYDATDRLATIHGSGSVSGPPPHNTHCTNVGAVHRRELHPLLAEWFGIPVPDEDAPLLSHPGTSRGAPSDEHRSLVLDAALKAASHLREDRGPDPENRRLVRQVASLLGIDPVFDETEVTVRVTVLENDLEVARILASDGPEVELALLWPAHKPTAPVPAILAFCQHGWRAWRRSRRKLVNLLRQNGVAVCVTDLRGTGPADGDNVRGRHGAIAAIASSELMLGRTVLGQRITDLRAALSFLRSRPELDAGRLLLWGDSLAPTNPAEANLAVPFDAGPLPRSSEPLGGLAALLCTLFEDVRGVYARGLPARLGSLLESPFLYTPGDALPPGILPVAEIDDLAAALAPRALWMEGLVDGLNRPVDSGQIESALSRTRGAYTEVDAVERLVLRSTAASSADLVDWVHRQV